ncbi:hypothetical protein ACVMB3_007228 [Sinorhizobium meliloti]
MTALAWSSSSIKPDGTSRRSSASLTTLDCCSCRRVRLNWTLLKTSGKFMRDNWLSNRIFTDYEEIVAHGCAAWNKLVAQPWKMMSIGLREWAHRF